MEHWENDVCCSTEYAHLPHLQQHAFVLFEHEVHECTLSCKSVFCTLTYCIFKSTPTVQNIHMQNCPFSSKLELTISMIIWGSVKMFSVFAVCDEPCGWITSSDSVWYMFIHSVLQTKSL